MPFWSKTTRNQTHEIPSYLLRLQRTWTYIPYGQQLRNKVLQTIMIPPALWNACVYVVQFSFIIAHIPGMINTAVHYLSCVEMDPK